MLQQTRQLIERGMADGLHIGAQLYASIRGQPVAELVIGESRPGVAMTRETIVLWLSSSKPVAAVAILQLLERGLLALDDPVAKTIPEFAVHGKDGITIRHLLTHTSGFRWTDTGWPETDWDQIIARVANAKLERNWVPGEKAGYHPFTSWYILGEIVRRIDGRTYSQYVREEVFKPLGMVDCWIGMPIERYRAYGERIAILPDMEKPERPPHRYSTERGATETVPGGNGYGPIYQLGYFYEALLQGGQRGAAQVLQPETVDLMTSRHREAMFDETFRHVLDWGLGVIVNSNRYGAETVPYGYGRHSSDSTFGHSGSQSSAAFADPQHDLVVAVYLNGTPGERQHNDRIRAINTAIYEDLGLAAP